LAGAASATGAGFSGTAACWGAEACAAGCCKGAQATLERAINKTTPNRIA
jgi:hypothetical protein